MNELEKRTREIVRRNSFTEYNHIELVEVGPDRAVFRLVIGPNSVNGFGMVHGGALYAMADNATGCAVHTDGRDHVTQSGSLNFLSNQASGVILATARVRQRGRRTALASVDITNEEGKLLAVGDFRYYCVSEGKPAREQGEAAEEKGEERA